MGESLNRDPERQRAATQHGRAAVLRLAAWFDQADDATAHKLCTAAFALYPARHLGGGTEDTVAATDSWWNAPAADTSTARPGVRGPLAPVDDHGAQQVRLRDAAEAEAHWRRAAADEVRTLLGELTPRSGRLTMSASARGVFMELLTRALGSGDATAGPVTAGDLELDIRLHARHDPAAALAIGDDSGDLTLNGLRLRATPYAQHHLDPDGPDTPAQPATAPTENAPAPPADPDPDNRDPAT